LTILVTGIYLQMDKAFWTNCGNCLLSTALQICKVEHIRRIFRTLSLLSAALLLKWSLCLNWDALRENASKTAWTSAELDARILHQDFDGFKMGAMAVAGVLPDGHFGTVDCRLGAVQDVPGDAQIQT
jgi:hypothetical protein